MSSRYCLASANRSEISFVIFSSSMSSPRQHNSNGKLFAVVCTVNSGAVLVCYADSPVSVHGRVRNYFHCIPLGCSSGRSSHASPTGPRPCFAEPLEVPFVWRFPLAAGFLGPVWGRAPWRGQRLLIVNIRHCGVSCQQRIGHIGVLFS